MRLIVFRTTTLTISIHKNISITCGGAANDTEGLRGSRDTNAGSLWDTGRHQAWRRLPVV